MRCTTPTAPSTPAARTRRRPGRRQQGQQHHPGEGEAPRTARRRQAGGLVRQLRALLSDGRYFDWGFDGTGQLGDGSVHRSSDVPVRVHLQHRVTQVAQGGSIWTTARRWSCSRTAHCGPGATTGPPSWATGPRRRAAAGALPRPARGRLPDPGHRVGDLLRHLGRRPGLRLGGRARGAGRGRPHPHGGDPCRRGHRGHVDLGTANNVVISVPRES